MDRDGNTLSIWQSIVPFINLKQHNAEDVYDVIIIGAGITGLTTGLMLQQAGLNCLLLEARTIGFGTTSATTAHLNTILDTPYPELINKFGKSNATLAANAAKEAISLIKGNIDRYGIACDFEPRDGYMFAENEEEQKKLGQILDALGSVGISAAYTEEIPTSIPFSRAIKVKDQAQFNPVKYILALAEAFQESGGIILENTRVERSEYNVFHTLQSGSQEYKSHAVVYATHIPLDVNYLHFKCAPYRSYVLGIKLEDESYPEALIYDMQDPYHYFRTAYLDDEKILIVGGNDHKTGHNDNTEYVFTELEAYVRKHYSVKAVPYKWSSQYYEPVDGLPFIGHLPGGPDTAYVATGYSGNGMIFGTLAGQILTDLILARENPYTSLFSPIRIKPVASFKNFVKENADVVKHFVSDRLSPGQLAAFSDLSKEEGKIIKLEGEQIAIYKDEYGNLKALHPVCPHAGCIVQWNAAEKSWDCPCHGARYDVDGNLLNAPATSALRKISLEK